MFTIVIFVFELHEVVINCLAADKSIYIKMNIIEQFWKLNGNRIPFWKIERKILIIIEWKIVEFRWINVSALEEQYGHKRYTCFIHTVLRSSIRVITPIAISLLSAGASGQGYSVALKPSQIFLTLVFNWSPWKNMINTDFNTWSPWNKIQYNFYLNIDRYTNL